MSVNKKWRELTKVPLKVKQKQNDHHALLFFFFPHIPFALSSLQIHNLLFNHSSHHCPLLWSHHNSLQPPPPPPIQPHLPLLYHQTQSFYIISTAFQSLKYPQNSYPQVPARTHTNLTGFLHFDWVLVSSISKYVSGIKVPILNSSQT